MLNQVSAAGVVIAVKAISALSFPLCVKLNWAETPIAPNVPFVIAWLSAESAAKAELVKVLDKSLKYAVSPRFIPQVIK